MRRALQYHGDHRPPARAPLRGADALARRPDARGRRLGRARLRRLPVGGGERDGRARPLARRVRGPAPAPPPPLGPRVGRGARAARRRPGSPRRARSTPHHLCLTDEAVRSLDPNVKMNPPLRAADDRMALIDGLRDGTIGSVATDHAPHARHEKDVPVRGGAVRRHGARDGVRRALHRPRRAGRAPARDAARAHVRRAGARVRARGAADRGRRAREPRPARHGGHLAGRRGRLPLALGELVAARPDAQGPGAADRRRRIGRCTRDEGLPRARGRHRLPRRVGRAPRASRSARRSSRRR